MNQGNFMGNLSRDPEMKYTQGGTAFTTFNMAVNKRWNGPDGTAREKTTWFKVTSWGKLAETVSTWLKAGEKVLVVGEVDDSYAYIHQETGEARSVNQITAKEVHFLTPKNSGQSQNGQAYQPPSYQAVAPNGPTTTQGQAMPAPAMPAPAGVNQTQTQPVQYTGQPMPEAPNTPVADEDIPF